METLKTNRHPNPIMLVTTVKWPPIKRFAPCPILEGELIRAECDDNRVNLGNGSYWVRPSNEDD